jgi:chromosome segregation ATPase
VRSLHASKTAIFTDSEAKLRNAAEILSTERKQARQLRADMQTAATSKDSELVELKNELAELKNELRVANDRAEDMLQERDEARRKVEVLAASVERHLRGEGEVRGENEALKKEIARLNKENAARLKEWEKEKEDIKIEMELRGKLLLREWGRQEVGPPPVGEKQGYKYKYVKEG